MPFLIEDALSGNAVVERVHRNEFSGLPRGRQSGGRQLWNAACGSRLRSSGKGET